MAALRPIPAGQRPQPRSDRYARPARDVTSSFAVDPAVGLTTARAAEPLAANGPNALPEEKPRPMRLRFLDEYRSSMQIVLLAVAVAVAVDTGVVYRRPSPRSASPPAARAGAWCRRPG
jgi:magnesium-transporting ATPase (P-type)